MNERRNHSPEFKDRIAIEAIRGLKTIQEIAADQSTHPLQINQWKNQLLEGASELFTRGMTSQAKDENQAKEVRSSGFSGQGPSLTNEAGHRP